MNVRAWTVIEYCSLPHIILEFNNNKVGLARWYLPINQMYIGNKAKKLDPDFYVPLDEIEKSKVLFSW